jgi:hypothetical protein
MMSSCGKENFMRQFHRHCGVACYTRLSTARAAVNTKVGVVPCPRSFRPGGPGHSAIRSDPKW